MNVVMTMEEYKDLEQRAAKLQSVKRVAKDILVEHVGHDWAKLDELQEPLTMDECKLLLGRILGEGGAQNE